MTESTFRWLFIVGLGFDLAGAAVIAWPILYARRGELREEGTMRLGRNTWVIVARTREQRYVRFGVLLLGLGFLCQLVAHIADLSGIVQIGLGALVVLVVFGSALLISAWRANRGLPRYAQKSTRQGGIEEIRDLYQVRELSDVPLFWRIAAGQELKRGDAIVDVYVSHGRWVADCPCGGGMVGSPELEEVACTDCATLYRVRFPDERERQQIEALLIARPHKKNRNWRPGESVEDLRADNVQHGIPPLFLGGAVSEWLLGGDLTGKA
jgi:hypothetical protein